MDSIKNNDLSDKNIIASVDNKFYKLLKKLSKKKYRDENSIFKAEGEKFFKEKISFNKIIVKESKYDHLDEKYNLSSYSNITILKDNLFDEISDHGTSQGVIFLFSKNLNSINDIMGNVVILDDVQDPGNIGTIIRTMVAAGFDNLILKNGTVDVYNPKSVRATMGGIFKMNIIYETEENIISFLKDKKYKTIVTALESDSINYNDIKLNDSNNAFIFGHEGSGVSKQFLDIANTKAIIPIYGNIDSLNVSVAVGIFLYKMRDKINN